MTKQSKVRYGDVVGIQNIQGAAFLLLDPKLNMPLAYASADVNPTVQGMARWTIQSTTANSEGKPVNSGDDIILVQMATLKVAQNPQTVSGPNQDAVHYVGFEVPLQDCPDMKDYPGNWYANWKIEWGAQPSLTYSPFTLTMHFPEGMEKPYPGKLSSYVDTDKAAPYPFGVFAVNAEVMSHYDKPVEVYSSWQFVPVTNTK
jgi:hypothetical protein